MWNIKLSPYVALSRSSGRSLIRLLRDFDSKVFQAAHSDLLTEDDHLKALDSETQKQCEMMGQGQKMQLLESVNGLRSSHWSSQKGKIFCRRLKVAFRFPEPWSNKGTLKVIKP